MEDKTKDIIRLAFDELHFWIGKAEHSEPIEKIMSIIESNETIKKLKEELQKPKSKKSFFYIITGDTRNSFGSVEADSKEEAVNVLSIKEDQEIYALFIIDKDTGEFYSPEKLNYNNTLINYTK